MPRIVVMLRLALAMTAFLSSAAALPLVRGDEDLLEAGVHRKELPHQGQELRAVGAPEELQAGGVPMKHLLVSLE